MTRPPIPARIKRSVLVEAGHRCAIPTCRHITIDIHHIIPWAKCKTHEYDNLIALCPNCHRLAGEEKIDRKSLRIYKANLRFAHDKFSNLEIDMLFELQKLAEDQGMHWPPFNMLLIKRIIDAGYVVVQKSEGGVFIGGMKSDPDLIQITLEGRDFIESLSIDGIQ